MDRYAEQLWLTLFAKAPEITLFDISQITRPIHDSTKAPWQGTKTSFDFDEMTKPIVLDNGKSVRPNMVARAAGYTFGKVDKFLGRLGKPIGVKSYKPYHSTGEDFLHNYLGMVGIPIDLVPEFPTDANMILLTESAKFDKKIVHKIKNQLVAGKTVMITSGLLKALQGKGIEDVVELEYTDKKAVTKDFMLGWRGSYQSQTPIIIPQIKYLTNDSWEEISCRTSGIGYPILHSAGYANSTLYVLTIPDNFGDLYKLPTEVLTRIKEVLTKDSYVRVDGPSKVALFVYDNNTFIVESFLPEPIDIRIVTNSQISKLHDILSDEKFTGEALSGWRMRGQRQNINSYVFNMKIKPHSYHVFQCN